MRRLKAYEESATDSAPSLDGTYAEQLYRHYAGIPGWRGRDRNVLAKAAAHEDDQIRAADEAVIRDAREGRMP
jgi:hypothetical protein